MSRSIISREARDWFALGDAFAILASRHWLETDPPLALGAAGDPLAEGLADPRTRAWSRARYHGPDLAAALAACRVGGWRAGFLLDRLRLRLAEGAPTLVELSGHNHAAAPHAAPAPGAFAGFAAELTDCLGAALPGGRLPDAGPFAADPGAARLVALDLTIRAAHPTVLAAAGDHAASRATAGALVVRAEYLGTPALALAGWTVRTDHGLGERLAPDRRRLVARRHLARTTA